MKLTRLQIGLVAVLAVQILLILLVRSPFGAATDRARSAGPLVPEVETLEPTRIELTDAEGASLTLDREGDAWSIREQQGFPADRGQIDELLETLAGLKVRQPVVTSSRYHETFQVEEDENQARVRIWSDTDDPAVDLILGSSPNYRVTHVRRAGEDPVYEVSGLAAYEVVPQPTNWVEKDLVEVPREQISSIVIERESGRLSLQRTEDGWRATESPDRALAGTEVDALLDAARTIRLAEAVGPVDPAHGFDAPWVRVELVHGSDGAERTIYTIGAPSEDGGTQRFVTRDGFGFAGTVWASNVSPLSERTVESLLADADEPDGQASGDPAADGDAPGS